MPTNLTLEGHHFTSAAPRESHDQISARPAAYFRVLSKRGLSWEICIIWRSCVTQRASMSKKAVESALMSKLQRQPKPSIIVDSKSSQLFMLNREVYHHL
jgi:hypothetical protein